MIIAILLTIVIGALIYKLFNSKRNIEIENNFWQKYGIRQIDISKASSSVDIVQGKKSQSDFDDHAYAQLGPSEKYCGLWENGTPTLLIKDIEFVKKVLIKDFDHFVNRRLFFTKKDGILGDMLSSLQDEEWKGVRHSISPAFTTAKIRKMMEYFNSVGLEWVAELKKRGKSSSNGDSVVIDVLKAVNQYTTEVISSSVFGMRTDAITNPNSTFNVMANRVADFGSFSAVIKFAFQRHFPKLFKMLNLSPFDLEAVSFFEQILEQNLKIRMTSEENGKRNDFLELLIEAKKSKLEAVNEELEIFEKDAVINLNEDLSKKRWITDEMVRAQSIMFFFAGLSSTSNLITMILYALALHQDIQERLRQEVNKIVKMDGTLEYDDVGKLSYLDMVMNETLRKFPGGGRHERVCNQEYRDPETGAVIPKDSVVFVPVNAFHNDKQYFHNPDKFDPEHFSAERKAARNPYVFMPWGIGPRNCIGMRFAQCKVKSVVAQTVHNFLIEPTPKTPVPLTAQKVAFQLLPPKDLELKFTSIDNKR